MAKIFSSCSIHTSSSIKFRYLSVPAHETRKMLKAIKGLQAHIISAQEHLSQRWRYDQLEAKKICGV